MKKVIIVAHRKIFFKGNGDSHMAEALRLLRTNIHFIEPKKRRVILCTSTIPNEGKSFVSIRFINGNINHSIDCYGSNSLC